MNANAGDTNEAIQALIRSRRPVVTDHLRDSQLPTDEVLGAA